MLNKLKKMALAATLVAIHAVSQAEDIDLFVGSPTVGANVLILLDNTANWSAAKQHWPGGITQGEAELNALKTVINSLAPTGQDSAIKVGLMMLTDAGAGGGYVRSAMRPMTVENRAEFAALMDNIYADFSKPSEKVPASLDYDRAMFEVFKYFGGYTSPANATKNIAGTPIDTTHFGPERYAALDGNADENAFADSAKKIYNPASKSDEDCPPKNFLIFIGNGFPNIESSGLGTTLLSNVGGDTTQIYNESPLQNNRPTDEWARFLFKTDVSEMTGKQNVITYTINVCKDQCSAEQGRLLTSMANVGGGSPFLATSATAIQEALSRIFSEIQSVDSAFASASLPVSVNAQGTYLNQVFIGMFRPENAPRWYGNLKQYQFRADAGANGTVAALRLVDKTNNYEAINPINGFISPCAQSFWSTADTYWPGGYLGNCLTSGLTDVTSNSPDGEIVEKGAAAQRLRHAGISPDPARNVRTCSSCPDNSALEDFGTGNASAIALDVADTEQSNLVNWVRGQNVDNELSKGTTVMRPSVHGDVVHSRPLAIDYGGTTGVVVFYGGNDGMLRAINGKKADTDGNELWSFVAPEHYGKLKRLRSNSPYISFPPPPIGTTPKDYFFDGPIGVYSSGSTKWIYPTMRRGGRMVYAFNVNNAASPTLKWKRGCPKQDDDAGCSLGFLQIGQTWSEPKVVKVAGHGSGASPVMIMGGGYDTCEDQDAAVNTSCTAPKGNRVFVLDADTGTLLATLATDKSVAADVTVVDSDSDGLVDVAYAADTGGNLYRINIGTTVPGSWTIDKLAALGCTDTSCGLKFLHAPEVVTGTDFNAILIGSGNRERPLLTNQAVYVDNAFFMIKDDHSATPTEIITTSNLVEMKPNTAMTTEQQEGLALSTNKGWYLAFGEPDADLDLDHDKEQVVTSAVVFAGVVYFSTHQPVTPTACGANLGTARGYAVNYLDASTLGGLEKFSVFAGGGLPPSPVTGVVTVSLTDSDNNTVKNPDGSVVVTNVPFIIGGGAPPPGPPGCGISGLSPCLVNVDPSPVRNRTFWYIQQ